MDYVANQKPQLEEMLRVIGVSSVEELFEGIPGKLRLAAPQIDDGMSEYEGLRMMESLSAKNTFSHYDNYLGAGCYEHHIPAIVSAICSKSEFLTSYTPYQAEASQGMLQAIFEFQSAICALTGMDVANASVYDGASACAEGLLMALRAQKKRNKILVSQALHPHYKAVIHQYLGSQDVQQIELSFDSSGKICMHHFKREMDANTAAVLIQSPNFLGILENVQEQASLAKECGALSILCANPLAYGLFASAGELEVDIAVGECQPFGIPMQFGGPHAGYIACREALVRQLPGRLVGETVDSSGKRGFVLTLQAREQHIRREKATSNICTNQALAALASLITLLWYGKKGIAELASTNYRRTAYLKNQLSLISGLQLLSTETTFNEFVIRFERPFSAVQEHFRKHGIEPGLHLGSYFSQFKDHFLVAVTETKNQQQLDKYAQAAKFEDFQ